MAQIVHWNDTYIYVHHVNKHMYIYISYMCIYVQITWKYIWYLMAVHTVVYNSTCKNTLDLRFLFNGKKHWTIMVSIAISPMRVKWNFWPSLQLHWSWLYFSIPSLLDSSKQVKGPMRIFQIYILPQLSGARSPKQWGNVK